MTSLKAGRVIAAPESHLPAAQLRLQRRGFIRSSVAAGALVAGAGAAAQTGGAALIPPWTRSLGAPVVTTGYGMPSNTKPTCSAGKVRG